MFRLRIKVKFQVLVAMNLSQLLKRVFEVKILILKEKNKSDKVFLLDLFSKRVKIMMEVFTNASKTNNPIQMISPLSMIQKMLRIINLIVK